MRDALLACAMVTPCFATCDIIETNHVYNQDGSKRFVQTIFWRHNAQAGKYRVQAYVYTRTTPEVPTVRRDYRLGGWVASWARRGQIVQVKAATHHTTHTTYDIEVMDRKLLPICQRRGLGFPADTGN